MNVPKGFYVYGAAALFSVGFGLSLVNPESIAAAGAFVGAGLMGIASSITVFAKPAP